MFIDEERNGWMKICSNEIVCSLGQTTAALSARLCVSLVPVLKLYSQVLGPKNMAIIVYKILLHTNTTNIPNGRRCLSCSA